MSKHAVILDIEIDEDSLHEIGQFETPHAYLDWLVKQIKDVYYESNFDMYGILDKAYYMDKV